MYEIDCRIIYLKNLKLPISVEKYINTIKLKSKKGTAPAFLFLIFYFPQSHQAHYR